MRRRMSPIDDDQRESSIMVDIKHPAGVEIKYRPLGGADVSSRASFCSRHVSGAGRRTVVSSCGSVFTVRKNVGMLTQNDVRTRGKSVFTFMCHFYLTALNLLASEVWNKCHVEFSKFIYIQPTFVIITLTYYYRSLNKMSSLLFWLLLKYTLFFIKRLHFIKK